jgi:ribosomal protein S18 acetylase RimI-like enzyme
MRGVAPSSPTPSERRPSQAVDHIDVRPLEQPDIDTEVVNAIGDLIRRAVSQGAALGWVNPPDADETGALVHSIASASSAGDAGLVVAWDDEKRDLTSGPQRVTPAGSPLVGLGYWRRYERPTHRVQADIPLLLVDNSARRQGVGGAVLDCLMTSARSTGIEQLTLDARGDNRAAHSLWLSRGFTRYGTLTDFVAVGDDRFDKTFWVADLRTT